MQSNLTCRDLAALIETGAYDLAAEQRDRDAGFWLAMRISAQQHDGAEYLDTPRHQANSAAVAAAFSYATHPVGLDRAMGDGFAAWFDVSGRHRLPLIGKWTRAEVIVFAAVLCHGPGRVTAALDSLGYGRPTPREVADAVTSLTRRGLIAGQEGDA